MGQETVTSKPESIGFSLLLDKGVECQKKLSA